MDQAIQTPGDASGPASGLAAATRAAPLRWWLLGALVGLAAARLAGIQGWITPIHVAGDSMAPTLLGEHQRVECPECAFSFRVSVADAAASDSDIVVCPNCGCLRTDRAGAAHQPGQRVWVDRFAYLLRPARRGELVALRDPLDPDRLVVKRVIGVPGEQVRIQNGDILLGSTRWQKSLDELREVAVLVHDDRWQPTRRGQPLPERWRDAGGWSVYHHWRCFASPLPRTDESPVLDNDSFNQRVSRQLHDAADLLLAGRMTAARGEQVIVRLDVTLGCVAVIFDADSRQIAVRRGIATDDPPAATRSWKPIATAELPESCIDHPVDCEVAVCDGRLLVGCQHRQLLVCDEEQVGVMFAAKGPTPWAVAIIGLQSQFVDRRVARDVYYLGPTEILPFWTAGRPLGANEYFLLGDNSPVSVDSRQWPGEGAVAKSRIVGRVLRGAALP